MNKTREIFRALSLSLTMALTACGPDTPQLRPVPQVELDAVSATVRAQIEDALSQLRDDATNPELNGRLGMLFDAYDRLDEAAAFYERAQFLEPGRFRWHYLHGKTLARLGEDGQALVALERALALRRGYPAAQLELARLVGGSGDRERAAELFGQLIERNPAFAQARADYGKFLLESGDVSGAVFQLDNALTLSNRFGQAHYLLAQCYRELGETDKASLHAGLFERYRRFGPASADPLMDEIQALNRSGARQLERALLLTASGQHERAARELETLAERSGESLAAHVNLIAVYGELGEYEKAQAHAERAIALDPESVEAFDNQGVLQLKQRELEAATASFLRASEIDPSYSVPYKNLGLVEEISGRVRQAIERYRSSLALDPYDRQTRFFLARSLLTEGLPDEAVAVIEPITRFDHPETPSYLSVLGQAYEMSGDLVAAEAALKRSMILAQNRGMSSLGNQVALRLDRIREQLRQ